MLVLNLSSYLTCLFISSYLFIIWSNIYILFYLMCWNMLNICLILICISEPF